MFELQRVTKNFSTLGKKIQVLENFSYNFQLNKSYVITGPSGIGKTTLLNLLMGIDTPSDGAIFFHQEVNTPASDAAKDITRMARYDKLAYEQFLLHAIGVVFQQPLLVSELSIVDTIGFKGLLVGMSRNEIIARVQPLAEMLGLTPFLQQPASLLSGGQQQRVALGRALFLNPKFLLIDEPTAHLDAKTAQEMVKLLKEVQIKTKCGLIVASHDPLVIENMEVRIDLGKCSKN